MNEIRFDLDRDAAEELKRRALAHGVTMEEEARRLVQQGLRTRPDRAELVARARRIRSMAPVGVQTTDSVQLIREDRER